MIKNIIKFSIALAITAAISGFLLAKVYLIAKPNIEKQKELAESSAKKVIFPNGTNFIEVKDSILNYEIVKKDGEILGYLYKASKYGYSSHDVSLVGVDDKMKIKGIVILSQKETPGLGARIEEVKSDKYIWTFWKKSLGSKKPWFQAQFEGLNAEKLNLKKGKEWKDLQKKDKDILVKTNTITALSGATISSNAVMSSIKESAKKLKKILEVKNIKLKKVDVDTNGADSIREVSDGELK